MNRPNPQDLEYSLKCAQLNSASREERCLAAEVLALRQELVDWKGRYTHELGALNESLTILKQVDRMLANVEYKELKSAAKNFLEWGGVRDMCMKENGPLCERAHEAFERLSKLVNE